MMPEEPEENTISIGYNASSIALNAIALGSGAKASAENAITIGKLAKASVENAIAIGAESESTAEGSTSLGISSKSSGKFSLTNGYMAQATGESATALGSDAVSSSKFATSIGAHTSAKGEASVAIGYNATASSGSSISIGNNSFANGAGNHNTLALGNSASVGTTDHGYGETIALGANSKIMNYFSTGIGNSTYVKGQNSVALGYESATSDTKVISMGHKSTDLNSSGTAFGTDLFRRITNVDEATDEHDVTNLAQVKRMVTPTATVKAGDYNLISGDAVYKTTSLMNATISDHTTKLTSLADSVDKYSKLVGQVQSDVTTINQNVLSAISSLNSSLDNYSFTSLSNLDDDGKAVIKDIIKQEFNKLNAKSASSQMADNNGIVTLADTVNRNIVAFAVDDGNATVSNNLSSMVAENTANIASNKDAIAKNTENIANLQANKADIDGGNINVEKFTEKLDTGSIEENNTGLVSGGKVYTAVDTAEKNSKAYTDKVAQGLSMDFNQQMGSLESRMNQNINRGVAGASALAALKPLDYDGDDKFNFAVGYGHYKGANATALGAFYYFNPDIMLNLGATFGNGSPAMNAGLSFRLGSGSSYAGVSKAELAKKNAELQNEVEEQNNRIDRLESLVAQLLKGKASQASAN